MMQLIIGPTGTIRCIYDEAIDLRSLGSLVIERASHVEPDAEGRWWADLQPSHGPLLGSIRFSQRSTSRRKGLARNAHPECTSPFVNAL